MMSNVGLIIEERAANIGNFLVGRLLPFRQRRAVGPFVFIDHMGPAALNDYQNLDVPPHPHIGLSTLTYLFEGAISHRDSMGNVVEIEPGAVNWMTAGRGVVHSERTPERLRTASKYLHGFQIWVGLPKDLEQCEPDFCHIESRDIPVWNDDGLDYKLIAGEAFGRKSPVPVHSKLFFVELKSNIAKKVNLGKDLYGEAALYILDGTVLIEGNSYGAKQLLVANEAQLCEFEMSANSIVYLFGGEPFEEERFMFWNFVNSDKSLIEKAKLNWSMQAYDAFPLIPGDSEDYVRLPEIPFSAGK